MHNKNILELFDEANILLEKYIAKNNAPLSAGPLMQKNIVRLLNLFNKPPVLKYKINKDIYDYLFKQVDNKSYSKLENAVKLILQNLGYVNIYSEDVFKFVLYNKILINAIHESLNNNIFNASDFSSKKDYEKAELTPVSDIISKFVADRNTYVILFVLDLLPFDTVSILQDTMDMLAEIKYPEIQALYLTPCLAYLEYISEVMQRTYKYLYSTTVITDALVFLFLYMRYNSSIINAFKKVKYPNINFNYEYYYEQYLKDYVEAEKNKLNNFVLTKRLNIK